MKRLFQHAEIASEDSPKLTRADVLVEDGKIVQVAPSIAAGEGVEVIDCSGKVILPGFFDVHVHAREPGGDQKENIRTCSEAAINGGVTGFVMMPNTSPAIDNAGVVKTVLESARKCRIPIYTSGAITKGREGKELAAIGAMHAAGVVMITDDGYPVSNPVVLRRAMEYAKNFGLIVASHCETMELSGKGSMHEGSKSYSLGLEGIPAISEEICLDRDIRIGQYTGAHVHIQHVTTARGMNTIRRFKEEGVKVTCEVAPHHLIFNHEDVGEYDTNYKMNPPLRTKEDNAALLQGLIDGVFDVIATDHAPHTEFEKNNDFGSAPFGVTGLETALPSLYHYFIKEEKFGWDLLVKRYSAEPRRLLGHEPVPVVEGGVAEFIVFNPRATSTFTRQFMKSKSINTPFYDKTLQGRVDTVVLGDEVLLSR
ncbi:dihydroorotase [Roseimicrobium sp. ORNL1]|uniref:dihydroorotase n=1 Tax=Roseimicrobium sp. ORNL1 TaxID=2711231 RepID=UPI0013E15F95|nr:dihydroorotase [Roseimicrobium sp. ORNL1]QIF01406.1 dihydroorotase [Roseimicrobium sp. ORNL1]